MLKPILLTLSAACLAASVAQAQANPFIGEWKIVPSKSTMPDEMKVERKDSNTYAFDFGGSVETIVLDGTDQPGVGGTLLSVKPQAPDTWIVRRKTGTRLLLNATWTLSSDQRTLSDHFRGFAANGDIQSVDYVYQRTGGGSGFTADWRSIKETINPPFVLDVKAYQGGGLTIVDPLEQRTKNVTFVDKDRPANGASAAAAGAVSSLRRTGERTLVITDEFNGKVAVTEELVLSPDLQTLTMTVHAIGHDRPDVLVFERA